MWSLLAMFGCGKTEKVQIEQIDSAHPDIAIKSVPEDEPKFKQIYVAVLDYRATITITARTWWHNERSFSGELTQPDGRYILFDPDAIADKILDPILVPLVQQRVDEIKRLDKTFIASKPSEFIDESGVTWRRQP